MSSKVRLSLAFNNEMLNQLAAQGVDKAAVDKFVARMASRGRSCVDAVLVEDLATIQSDALGVASSNAVESIVDVLTRWHPVQKATFSC